MKFAISLAFVLAAVEAQQLTITRADVDAAAADLAKCDVLAAKMEPDQPRLKECFSPAGCGEGEDRSIVAALIDDYA